VFLSNLDKLKLKHMKFLEGLPAAHLTSLWQEGILFGFGLSKLATVPNPLNPRVKKQEFNW